MSVPIGMRRVDAIGVPFGTQILYALSLATSNGFHSVVGEYIGGI